MALYSLHIKFVRVVEADHYRERIVYPPVDYNDCLHLIAHPAQLRESLLEAGNYIVNSTVHYIIYYQAYSHFMESCLLQR